MGNAYEARVRRVLDHIHANPAADLSLDALADLAAMSRFHWHRVFQAMTGETCAGAVRRIRMYRASYLLAQTQRPMAQIAADVGYDNAQSFARAFQAVFHDTPVAFRARGLVPAPSDWKQKDFAMYQGDVKQVPERHLVGLCHIGPYYEMSEAFARVAAVFSARGLWSEARGMVGIFMDDPQVVAAAELQSWACVEVAEAFATPEGLERRSVAAGPAAVLLLKGPYAGLQGAYDYLYGKWLPESGREPADAPSYERYLNDASNTPPDELLTEINLPLAG